MPRRVIDPQAVAFVDEMLTHLALGRGDLRERVMKACWELTIMAERERATLAPAVQANLAQIRERVSQTGDADRGSHAAAIIQLDLEEVAELAAELLTLFYQVRVPHR